MPVCPDCGKQFSGFSFGSKPATECRDCRKAKEAQASIVVKAPVFTPTVTLSLIALNGLVYVGMILSGVSWNEPSVVDAIRWGADFGPLTFSGQWWRLLTSTFVHFGIIHIAFNMWCLYDLGRALELLMGRARFVLTYLASGLAASMVSLAWNPWRVSAGASGAIFGVAGAFLSYLYLKRVPLDPAWSKSRMRSLVIFVGYNLLYGAANGTVDNSAHLGGLVAGLALGAMLPRLLQANAADPASDPRPITIAAAGQKFLFTESAVWLSAAVSAAVLCTGAVWLYRTHASAVHYGRAVKAIERSDLQRGIVEAQQAATLDPNQSLALAMLGDLQLTVDQPHAALDPLERIEKIDPNIEAEHNLALAFLADGNPYGALVVMRPFAGTPLVESEKRDPWRAQYMLAMAQEQTGDLQRAKASWQAVLAAKPGLPEAQQALTRIQSGSGSAALVNVPIDKLMIKSEAWPLYP